MRVAAKSVRKWIGSFSAALFARLLVISFLEGLLILGNPVFAQQAKTGSHESDSSAYPNKPVRWVVGLGPGGSNDIIARLIAQKLSESLGKQFLVDNRPGGGGSLGAGIVARANPDGYTILLANPGPNVINIQLRKDLDYKYSDFSPVIFIGHAPLILVAHPKFPADNAKELVAYAKSNPGKISWGSSGVGSILHIGLAIFQSATGVSAVHVPYKSGGLAIADLVSGQVPVMFTTLTAADSMLRASRLKVIGVAGQSRLKSLPQVPTLTEVGIPNADVSAWYGVLAPAKTPRAVVSVLNLEINKVLKLPDIERRLLSEGLVFGGGTPQEFSAFMKSEMDRLALLVKTGQVSRGD